MVERPAVAVAYPMLWLFVVLTMGCFVKLLLQKLKEKKNIGIPYSVVLLSLGMFLGALAWTEEASSALPDSDSDIWTLSLSSWTEMDPRLILSRMVGFHAVGGDVGCRAAAAARHKQLNHYKSITFRSDLNLEDQLPWQGDMSAETDRLLIRDVQESMISAFVPKKIWQCNDQDMIKAT